MNLHELKTKVPEDVLWVLEQLQAAGYEAYFVGGCVRDMILKRAPQDYDIAAAALPEEIAGIFPDTRSVGAAFGTVTVLHRGWSVEVTSMRSESDYRDGRRPGHVDFSASIFTDLQRRDFSVNAMAFDGGILFDLFHGLTDIHTRVIRTVGRPEERFREDGLRLIRAVRMACKLGFRIHHRTLQEIMRNAVMIHSVAKERIGKELADILISSFPDKGAHLLGCTGLAHQLGFSPADDSLSPGIQYWQPLSRLPPDTAVRLAMWYVLIMGEDRIISHGTIKDAADDFTRLLGEYTFPRKVRERVKKLLLELEHFPYQNSERIRRMLHRLGKKDPEFICAYLVEAGCFLGYNSAEVIGWCDQIRYTLEHNECISIQELAVNGQELLEMGVPSGPQMTKILNFLLECVLVEPEKNTKDYLQRLAQNWVENCCGTDSAEY